jgi:hypothetical protein
LRYKTIRWEIASEIGLIKVSCINDEDLIKFMRLSAFVKIGAFNLDGIFLEVNVVVFVHLVIHLSL